MCGGGGFAANVLHIWVVGREESIDANTVVIGIRYPEYLPLSSATIPPLALFIPLPYLTFFSSSVSFSVSLPFSSSLSFPLFSSFFFTYSSLLLIYLFFFS